MIEIKLFKSTTFPYTPLVESDALNKRNTKPIGKTKLVPERYNCKLSDTSPNIENNPKTMESEPF